MNENGKNDIINRELAIENSVLLENMQKKNIYIENLEEEKQRLKKENKVLRENLDSIMYSRSYKIIQKVKKIVKRR